MKPKIFLFLPQIFALAGLGCGAQQDATSTEPIAELVSALSQCGGSCPAGYHPSGYYFSSSCCGSFGCWTTDSNAVTCEPNSGTSFGTCGLGCPTGYSPTSYDYDSSCCRGSCYTTDNNATTCRANCIAGGKCSLPGKSGVCASGLISCTSGLPVCEQVVTASPEVCGDGLDNDCNGVVDDPTLCMRPTCSASFSPPMACGPNTTVSWNCTNATSCTYSCTGTWTGSGSGACSGSAELPLDATGEHCSLVASGAGGTATVSVSTYCIPPPPRCSVSFGSRPACGGNAQVTWNCTGATSCTYSCTGTVVGSGALDCSGSTQLPVGIAGEHCIVSAVGAGGTGTATASTTCI